MWVSQRLSPSASGHLQGYTSLPAVLATRDQRLCRLAMSSKSHRMDKRHRCLPVAYKCFSALHTPSLIRYTATTPSTCCGWSLIPHTSSLYSILHDQQQQSCRSTVTHKSIDTTNGFDCFCASESCYGKTNRPHNLSNCPVHHKARFWPQPRTST